ncbi:MAG: hypothetical protein ACOCP4_05025 [Candidatus Woesearchaeota archaeon]
MAAGLFAESGYFMGNNLYSANSGNPKGIFEDDEINSINEEILKPFAGTIPKGIKKGYKWRWLSSIPKHKEIKIKGLKQFINKVRKKRTIKDRIKTITENKPFCFKDPRFSYTLNIWKPFLNNTIFICVFRHPSITAKSILKEVKQNVPKKGRVPLKEKEIIEIWKNFYEYVIKNQYEEKDKWLFIHYNQFFNKKMLDKIENFSGAEIDKDFPDEKLNKNKEPKEIPKEIDKIYRKLCDLAGYEND